MIYFLIILSLLFPLRITAGNIPTKPVEEKPKEPTPLVKDSQGNTINLTVNNYVNQNQDTQVKAKQEQKVSQNQTVFLNQIYEWGKKIDPHAYYLDGAQLLEHYKYHIISGTGAALYLYICTILIKENIFFQSKKGWGAWKRNFSNDELLGFTQAQLAEMLLKSIQARFLNRSNPTDFVLPLVRFVQTMEEEEKKLNRYLTICTWLKRARIIWLFPTSNTLIKEVKKRLSRLRILNHTFISWTSEYNVMMALQGTVKSTIGNHITRQVRSLARHQRKVKLHI